MESNPEQTDQCLAAVAPRHLLGQYFSNIMAS